MNALELLQSSPSLFIGIITILGLLIGSFLNVVIFRLPLMMERAWRTECADCLAIEHVDSSTEKFNLLVPGSRCPHCKAEIKAYQNIPVLSYLLLKGRCATCKTPISPRYPLIEAFCGLASGLVAWRFGYGYECLFALILTWSLIALSGIDIDHQLLPDAITLPILWLGLLLSLGGWFTGSHDSIIGATIGYLSLWTVYQLFKLATGKEGMGYGDFKLLALLGAWMGWQVLPVVILMSSLVGALAGISMILVVKHNHTVPIPFGPYLAVAGWLALLFGKELNQLYFAITGL